MSEKERRVSERSLENLKLGAESRRQGIVRHNFTILPETVQWLKGTGNASDTIDALVRDFKNGDLTSNHTHEKNSDNQVVSDDVYKRIEILQAELDETRSQLEKIKASEKDALDQLCDCHKDAFKAADLLKEALKLRKSKKGGYLEKIEEAIKLIDDI